MVPLSLSGQMLTIPLLGKEPHLYILSRHPSQSDQYIIITRRLSLMALTLWIRRHRHNLGDPVDSARAYLCLYREA